MTDNEVATYLFCAPLAQTRTTPLTIIEWNVVVKSLSKQQQEPALLLNVTASQLDKILAETNQSQRLRILKKIEARQKLGMSMVELKEMTNQGYEIMFRAKMPSRLKRLPQNLLPPFFYFAGDPTILTHRTLGVVGARDATEEELAKTATISKEAAGRGLVIISGGARGVDTTAVEACLQAGGKAVIFPSEGLAKWIKKKEIRHYVLSGQLLLMSSQKMNAPFSGSYAMQRNRYIHAPSDIVLVSSSKISGKKSSGTWEGVQDNIKYNWSTLFVIGQSEGVEKLKLEGKARPFTTFDDAFNKNSDSLRVNIDKQMLSIIRAAQREGLDKDTIKKKFLHVLDEQESRLNKIERKESIVHEQLNLEDYST